MEISPKGPKAARLRQRKFEVARKFRIPSEAIGGSLARSHRRCGKPTCRCANGEGHEQWTLTFMVDGKKRTHSVPSEHVEALRPLVEQAREFRDAVADVFSANAQLLVLWLQERTQRRR